MSLDGFLIGYGISYEDGGAPQKLEVLARATSAAGVQFDRLTVSAKEARDAIFSLGDISKGAASGVSGFDAALRESALGARSASSGLRVAADSFVTTGAAADAAAISIARYDSALTSARGSSFAAAGGGIGGGGRGGAGGLGGVGSGGGMPIIPIGGPMGAIAQQAAQILVSAAKDAAIGTAAYAIDALYEAGHFQTTMAAIGNLSGVKGGALDNIRSLVFAQGAKYAMSPDQAGRQYLDMARQTPTMTTAQRNQLFPELGKASVVLQATRGMTPTDTSEGAISFVHMFQAYTAAQMKQTMDTYVRSNEVMGVEPTRALTQYGYFVPTANRLGVAQKDDIVLQAELANMGMGRQRGGTGVRAFLMSDMGLGVGGAKATQQLKNLHILDAKGDPNFYKKGADGQMHLLPQQILDQLNTDDKKMGDKAFLDAVHTAYGVQGANVVNALTSNVQTSQRHGLNKQLSSPSLGLDNQFNVLNNQFDKTFVQSLKDFQALATEVGTLMLPAATKGFHELGDALHAGQEWLHGNKDAERAFMGSLVSDVSLVANTINAHRSDFIAIGEDVSRFGAFMQGLVPTAAAAGGALLSLTRILGDVATFNTGDLVTMAKERSAAIFMSGLSGKTHDQRVQAILEYQAANGTTGFSASVDNAIAASRKSYRPGPDTAAAGVRMPMGTTTGLVMMPGAVVVHANGMTPEQAAKAVTDGTVAAAMKILSSPDPRHVAGKTAAILTSPRQPTRLTTPPPS